MPCNAMQWCVSMPCITSLLKTLKTKIILLIFLFVPIYVVQYKHVVCMSRCPTKVIFERLTFIVVYAVIKWQNNMINETFKVFAKK